MPDLSPWDRQPGEPPAAFQAFTIYRDMGLRSSLTDVSRTLEAAKRTPGNRLIFPDLPPELQPDDQEPTTTKPRLSRSGHRGSVGLWSRKWSWVDRCEAWDLFLDRSRQQIYRDKVVEMAERHANEASFVAKALMVGVSEFAKSVADRARMESFKRESSLKLLGVALECAKQLPKIWESERESRGVRVTQHGEEEPSTQGGDFEWVIKTYQPPREGPEPELALAGPAGKTSWEGDTPQPEEEDPAEGQAFPPKNHL